MEQGNLHTNKEESSQTGTEDERVCSKCKEKISPNRQIFCSSCYVGKMWEIAELEKVKKIVDEIIDLNKSTKKKVYSDMSYEVLFGDAV